MVSSFHLMIKWSCKQTLPSEFSHRIDGTLPMTQKEELICMWFLLAYCCCLVSSLIPTGGTDNLHVPRSILRQLIVHVDTSALWDPSASGLLCLQSQNLHQSVWWFYHHALFSHSLTSFPHKDPGGYCVSTLWIKDYKASYNIKVQNTVVSSKNNRFMHPRDACFFISISQVPTNTQIYACLWKPLFFLPLSPSVVLPQSPHHSSPALSLMSEEPRDV